MKLLGVVIANGFASEARVAALLLSHRKGTYEPLVLHHAWPGDRDSADRFESASEARVVRFDAGWRPNPRADRSFAAKLGSWAKLHAMLPWLLLEARRFQPDAVYSSQQLWDCYAAGLIARALRVPQIVHLHYTIGPYLGRTTLCQLRRCECVVAISDFIRRDALTYGVRGDVVRTIPNAIAEPPGIRPERLTELRRGLGLEPGQPVAAIIARIDPTKGHADAIEAFGSAARTLPGARLLVVGDGTARAALEADIAARGLTGQVAMLGWRNDAREILELADVFIHPSRREPFGLAILEASAAGKPVVAYAEGGIPEVVANGETGILVEPGDRAALGEALAHLLSDREMSLAMGVAGRARVLSRFRPSEAGARFSALIAEVVAAKRDR
jgi:glycosyltransferase involved in cell wall biosynthesis